MAEYDDLATLSSIDPSIVMQTLKDRHVADKVYTKNGAVLVAINPYKAINLYTDAHLQKYKESMALETEAPHIFAVAATTHRSLISEGKNQAVIISGESGAGKTESARFCASVSSVRVQRNAGPGAAYPHITAAHRSLWMRQNRTKRQQVCARARRTAHRHAHIGSGSGSHPLHAMRCL